MAYQWISKCSIKSRGHEHQLRPKLSQRTEKCEKQRQTRMWANAQPDGRPAEHRWRPLFNAAKFG